MTANCDETMKVICGNNSDAYTNLTEYINLCAKNGFRHTVRAAQFYHQISTDKLAAPEKPDASIQFPA